ncbi:MAG: DNA translocase FtsK, partial [candidate division Zixibacteria bacterium]|nr:DNA translocase FtsK [candidate division Zixibacteria bacterium]
ENAGGIMGAFWAYLIMFLFGKLGWLLPPAMFFSGILVFSGKGKWYLPFKARLAILNLFILSIIFTIPIAGMGFNQDIGYGYGGVAGYLLAKLLKLTLGSTGAYLLTITLMLIIAGIIFPTFSKILLGKLYSYAGKLIDLLFKAVRSMPGVIKAKLKKEPKPKKSKIKIVKPETPVQAAETLQPVERPLTVNIKRETAPAAEDEPVEEDDDAPVRQAAEGTYVSPDLSLLDKPDISEISESDENIKQRAEALKATLNTFKININDDSLESYPGPVITRFEFQPAPGVKVSQIVNLADDLALALKAKSIRVIAPIPGKGAVGVEIPNVKPQLVRISELLNSNAFKSSSHVIPLALGKDTQGHPFITDLSKMPHLLIAGATGAGKSVCLNSIITSILYKLHPDKVRFMFIDPKRLELSVYAGIPHLERPVVTRARQAERVLIDAVEEMENRYSRLAEAGVRNIEGFNEKIPIEEQLPYIIIVVDELADLLAGSSNKIELMITRLAQMARAVGIHLILATQRPSVDVITGLIKANFSSRIAFQVASKIDSRTILDANGAEKLLGSGDMLVMLTGKQELIRVHGSFVSNDETARIVEFLKDKDYKPKPVENLQPGKKSKKQSILRDASDELFKQAAETVVIHKQGSVSLLQRRLGVGYQRAARLIDQLEEVGVVGPYDGSKARKVLVNEQYLQTLFSGKSSATQ